MLGAQTILITLYPDMEWPAVGMVVNFLLLPLALFGAAIATGIACYKTCRYFTAPWSESKPLAFEIGTVMAVLMALAAAFGFWAMFAEVLAVTPRDGPFAGDPRYRHR